MCHLSVAVEGGEVEEERLSQGDGVDGVVHVVTAVELHLSGGTGRETIRTRPLLLNYTQLRRNSHLHSGH